jgi:uncharacterized metal-binding protein YceD (DUF177 family)
VLDTFKIWIDRLKDGQTQKIDTLLPSTFLDINEKELQFPLPVKVLGEAYLADTHLVLHLNASTEALMPCAICNEMIETTIQIKDFYHTEPLEDIREAIFDFNLILREALLLEIPQYVECNEGKCSQRELISPFLRKKKQAEPDVHFPFSGLDT